MPDYVLSDVDRDQRARLDAIAAPADAGTFAILDHLGVAFETVDVLQDPEIRNGIKAYSDWPTIPQLYVKGDFVGGSDIMMEMFEAGELQQLLTDKQVARA